MSVSLFGRFPVSRLQGDRGERRPYAVGSPWEWAAEWWRWGSARKADLAATG